MTSRRTASESEGATILTRKSIWPGKVVKLDLERVRLPGGHVAELEVVHHQGASCVVPFVTDDEIILERLYRHAAGGYLVEVPAGKLDPGEAPEACARRELEEETGWRAGKLVKLGALFPSPGFSDEIIHVFAASRLRRGRQSLEPSEILTVLRVPFVEALAMVADGRIQDGKSIAALALAAWARGVAPPAPATVTARRRSRGSSAAKRSAGGSPASAPAAAKTKGTGGRSSRARPAATRRRP